MNRLKGIYFRLNQERRGVVNYIALAKTLLTGRLRRAGCEYGSLLQERRLPGKKTGVTFGAYTPE